MIDIGTAGLFELDPITGKRASANRIALTSSSGTLLSRMPSLAGGIPNSGGWSFGTMSGGALTVGDDGDGLGPYLRASYPTPSVGGATYIYGGYSFSELKQDVYVQFWARMPEPRHGLKFLKLFGEGNGVSDWANVTFGADYTGIADGVGTLYQVSFGDGTNLTNDTAHTVNYNGNNPASVGRSYPDYAVVSTPTGNFTAADWGTGWHKFQFRAKMNSGTTSENEVADGAFDVYIDDVPYVIARNIFNRNPINGFLASIGLFGQSQTGSEPFVIDNRDVTVSENGWVD